jgi:hypothetical protein
MMNIRTIENGYIMTINIATMEKPKELYYPTPEELIEAIKEALGK